MQVQENISVKSKTTMRIGGRARYYAELSTKEDVEAAVTFTQGKGIPLIVLGGGSNTVFAGDVIDALVVRIKASSVMVSPPAGRSLGEDWSNHGAVIVEAGKILAVLINELAALGLDLSPLTGIPGTVGGAIFGNAGQGPRGPWLDAFTENVTAFVGHAWRTLPREECGFRYRESWFKDQATAPIIIWSVTLTVPRRPSEDVKADIERLLHARIETQPHLKTAGSCFKAVGDTPAWKLIDSAGLRGKRVGDVQIADKHTNFLLNVGEATFEDTVKLVEEIQSTVGAESRGFPLQVEMRFYRSDGTLAF